MDTKYLLSCPSCRYVIEVFGHAVNTLCRKCGHLVVGAQCVICESNFRAIPNMEMIICTNCGRSQNKKESIPATFSSTSPPLEAVITEVDPEVELEVEAERNPEIPLPVLKFYDILGLSAENAISYKDRKVIRGIVLSATGVTGLVVGETTLVFDKDSINFAIHEATNSTSIRYEDVTEFNFSGRGAFQTKSGGNFVGGGFGLTGAAEGMLMASALNALTTRKHDQIETITTLEWRSGGLVILSVSATPEQFSERFRDVSKRIEKIMLERVELNPLSTLDNASSPQDIASQLERLSALHKSEILSDEEFAAAKSKLLFD